VRVLAAGQGSLLGDYSWTRYSCQESRDSTLAVPVKTVALSETFYGQDEECRIADPHNPGWIFSFADLSQPGRQGQCNSLFPCGEDSANIDLSQVNEWNQTGTCRYANRTLTLVKNGSTQSTDFADACVVEHSST
jgi:hypothetical protein